MFRIHWMIGLLLISTGLPGCGKKPDAQVSGEPASSDATALKTDAIAVIDLNVVAEEIGARTKINDSLKQRETELVAQLKLPLRLDETV